jgi:hypothetical protein
MTQAFTDMTDRHADTFQILRERLLARHPGAADALERLASRLAGRPGYGAFAPIERGCCAACRVRVAAVRRLAIEAGDFMACPNCSRFLFGARAAREE